MSKLVSRNFTIAIMLNYPIINRGDLMDTYILPIKTAFLTFPILAFLVTLPFLIYQYRKYKYVNKIRSFILYSFLLYMLVSFYLVILPLPTTRDTCSIMGKGIQYFQLEPFNFIKDIGSRTQIIVNSPSSYIKLLNESVFFQAAFNGILLLPLGIYLRYYFKKGLIETVVTTFLVSLLFEITQITGLYGIYNCPYRVFDVDDLILNTFGGLLGFILTPLFTFFLPKAEELDENIDLEKKKVGYIRRFIAFSIDWFIIFTILYFLPIKREYIIFEYVGAVFIYFIIGVYITKGKTIGKSFIKIKIQSQTEKLSFVYVFIRYSFLYYGVFGVNYLLLQGIILRHNTLQLIALSTLLFLLNAVLIVHAVLKMAEKDNRLFYERISRTKSVISVGDK